MFFLVCRVVGVMTVIVSAGVVACLDERVLGTAVMVLTTGMLLFGVIGAAFSAWFVGRAVCRALRDIVLAPEQEDDPANAARPRQLVLDAQTSRRH